MEELPVMNQEQLQAQVSDGKYILFFTAGWCPDCNFIKPAMPAIESEFPEYTFIKVDRDDNIDLCKELDVFGIPSFIAYDHGKETGRLVNKARKTQTEVEDFIKSLPTD
ncbi:thioredoxin family protein [Fructilactobacillus myrtifloralis]|uniref:Thioredoxin family protein n=1 Tax=Fructilactobacillus myrtifloralis TaxID=2940301 RepID=A0ABY5BSJ9_9LACO|nr:thioredoxin family protein [Fructilactobacillus myrtifloralis]USS85233.1 thioredoxin family protein [Fructilactobacillus myrtifloralis]